MPLAQEAIETRARSLRLILLDVDGVLTDGAIHVHSDGSESKAFFIRDGAAIVWARREGLQVGLLSGRPSEATTRRAAELGIEIVVQGGRDKGKVFEGLLDANDLTDAQVGYMGDDLLDLPILNRVGLAAAPADAAPEVRGHAHWVSRYPGGRGAVREFVELVLRARGRWDALVRTYQA
jgi:3-deoxy-D-manno-octulosonate 8-phosphate phosphatase (KDO 8-P phosphatase)